MRRAILVVACCLALGIAGGCADHKLCAESIRSYWGPIKPEYQKYIQADPELSKPERAKDKKYRMDAIQGMDDTLRIMEGGK